MAKKRALHKAVLLAEVIDYLHIDLKKAVRYIDATLGAGGHSKAMLEAGEKVVVLGIEVDPKMIEIARKNLGGDKIIYVQGNFRDIDEIAESAGFEAVDGVLADLGISSVHLDTDDRGFSFKDPGRDLDMRLDPKIQGVSASGLLNALRLEQLRAMFEPVMDWGLANKLSREIVRARENKKFETVGDLLNVTAILPRDLKINPATTAFMALRIAVNSEIVNLKEFMPKAFELLAVGGRLVIISFHSIEDGAVKEFINDKVNRGVGKDISKGVVEASGEETYR